MATLMQHFGSAQNLNIHFHMLFLDGVYVGKAGPSTRFRWVEAPTSVELTTPSHDIWCDNWSVRDCWFDVPMKTRRPEA